jgi:hypothetical protein
MLCRSGPSFSSPHRCTDTGKHRSQPPALLAGTMSKHDGKVFIGGLSWETTGMRDYCIPSSEKKAIIEFKGRALHHSHRAFRRQYLTQMKNYVDTSKILGLYRKLSSRMTATLVDHADLALLCLPILSLPTK